MVSSIMQSGEYQKFRAQLKAMWRASNAPCGICGHRTIDYDGPPNQPDSFELDHKTSRKKRPDLALDPGNAQPSHHRCNRGKGAGDQRPALGETTEDY